MSMTVRRRTHWAGKVYNACTPGSGALAGRSIGRCQISADHEIYTANPIRYRAHPFPQPRLARFWVRITCVILLISR